MYQRAYPYTCVYTCTRNRCVPICAPCGCAEAFPSAFAPTAPAPVTAMEILPMARLFGLLLAEPGRSCSSGGDTLYSLPGARLFLDVCEGYLPVGCRPRVLIWASFRVCGSDVGEEGDLEGPRRCSGSSFPHVPSADGRQALRLGGRRRTRASRPSPGSGPTPSNSPRLVETRQQLAKLGEVAYRDAHGIRAPERKTCQTLWSPPNIVATPVVPTPMCAHSQGALGADALAAPGLGGLQGHVRDGVRVAGVAGRGAPGAPTDQPRSEQGWDPAAPPLWR